MKPQRRIRCVVMRGGTSKGVFFHAKDLPADAATRDRVLLAAFGSPDARQIDGLGGANALTSKAAIIAPAADPDIDVNYTFGQVSIDNPLVDYCGNCGNISSAVGPFAIDEGLVPVQEPVTIVRIFNTNTRKIIEAAVPVIDGCAAVDGDCIIAGAPGSGASIGLTFIDPGGAVTGHLLPTGRPTDRLAIPGWGELEVSLVDAGNPAVFFRAHDAGLTATETLAELESQPGVLALFEQIRSQAAVMMGLVEDASLATLRSPAVPKVTAVAPSATYTSSAGHVVTAGAVDLVARTMSMQRPHGAFALTGAIALAAAATLPGSVVAAVVGPDFKVGGPLRIGHPAGTMDLTVEATAGTSEAGLRVTISRTARRLMDGYVYVSRQIWPDEEATRQRGSLMA